MAHTPGLHIAALVPHRPFALAALACPAAAALAAALPLLEVPGFELGLAASLAAALVLGPALGIAAARRAGMGAEPARAFTAAAAAVSALLALALAASALRARLLSPCRPLASVALYALLAFPSGLLAAALGVLAATIARGRRGRAALLYAAAALLSLGATLAVAYLGPAASASDHLLGVWPGPLYDEALTVDPRLLLFRAGTLAWTAGALAAAALVARRRAGAPARAAAVALAAALATAGAARAAGGRDPTRDELAAWLGGVREGPRCTVHFAGEKRAAEAERILRDCEYDAHAVAAALGLATPPHAAVWIYRSPAEKRRLVGAGGTSFTKPWLAEVHVNDEGTPHPLLRHELVHALASAAARGPLRVPARAGVLVNAGLVEGLAVALEAPRPGEGIHAWTRALRDEGRLPALASLMHGGFLGAAPARAYTAAGSFLAFLIGRHGSAPVLAAYRDDDVAAALGRPLAELDAEWERFLDGVAVPPPLAAAAEARFAKESLFARRCAREVASDEVRAAEAAAAGRATAAEALLRRASALSGGDPAFLRRAADAWRDAGALDRAAGLYREALAASEAAGGRRALRSALSAALGDLALRRGDARAAEERYRAALALGADGAEARALEARLAACADPALRGAVAPWLLQAGDPALALARLAESDAPLARYLLARARLARGAPSAALRDLAALDPSSLPGPAFREEARRMSAEALCLAGRFEESALAWRAIAREATAEGTKAWAEDGARRCEFERDEYGRAVAWEVEAGADGARPMPGSKR